MSPRRPVPIRDLATRLPDAGRIRIGVKVPTNGKSRPEKIDRFRFTSQDRQALDQVAAIYGGQVSEWKEPKAAPGQWQVITDARELRIALPPDPLGNTPIYELWSGGGNQRRCDGEICEMLTQGQDGLDLQQVPCVCDRKQTLECSLHTRLSVLLPEVRFGGVWRLDTKGSNAAHELPGMVDLIRSLQDKGIIRATMRVEWRKQVVAGQTREFAVPVLGVDASPDELVAGRAQLGALGPGPTASQAVGELSAGATDVAPPAAEQVPSPTPPPPPLPDDEVVDAELVDEPPEAATGGPVRGVSMGDAAQLADQAFESFKDAAPRGKKTGAVERVRRAVTWLATECRTASLRECNPAELADVWRKLERINAGHVLVEADPLDPAGGVTFRWKGGERSVVWSEFEREEVGAHD